MELVLSVNSSENRVSCGWEKQPELTSPVQFLWGGTEGVEHLGPCFTAFPGGSLPSSGAWEGEAQLGGRSLAGTLGPGSETPQLSQSRLEVLSTCQHLPPSRQHGGGQARQAEMLLHEDK